jgi:elongation factor G
LQELGAKFDIGPIPEDLQSAAEEWREKLVEAAVEVDDDAMEAYLEGEVHLLRKPLSLLALGGVCALTRSRS